MSIIKHIWDYLDHHVCTCTLLPHNIELWDVLVEEWSNIKQEYITKLFKSMPDHVQALLKAKGGHTKY
ncbi:hypothetical protein BDR04DRAFT_1028708 [Suillus decipiens]|nr:hypothetical protein BDR04DRAFT_1028708 [Suillus decipiens]